MSCTENTEILCGTQKSFFACWFAIQCLIIAGVECINVKKAPAHYKKNLVLEPAAGGNFFDFNSTKYWNVSLRTHGKLQMEVRWQEFQ